MSEQTILVTLRAWLLRLCGVFSKSRRDADLAAELEGHIRIATDEFMRSGLNPVEARRRAILQLGGIEAVKEDCRDRSGVPLLDTLAQDIRCGARMFARNPGFTATAVLTLALGIGATTAIFTVVNGVLLRPLPYPEPERLVYLKTQFPGSSENWLIGGMDFVAFARRARTLSHVAAFISHEVNLIGGGQAERAWSLSASASLLPMLNAQPALGRNFLAEEEHAGAAPVAILSHALWTRRFHADRGVIGKPVTLDGVRHTIVGVMPESFVLADRWKTDADVIVPLVRNDVSTPKEVIVLGVGRLAPGVGLEAARAELDSIEQSLPRRRQKAPRIVLESWQHQVGTSVRTPLLVFLSAVGMLLLVACVNVANLLLSRGLARTRELAVRRALGAGRIRIVRQLLVESAMLALAGGLAGLALAYWAKGLLLAFLSRDLPSMPPVGLDTRVLAFNLALALVAGIGAGLVPALHLRDPRMGEALKESGRGATQSRSAHRLRDSLVVAEIALATVILLGAGLLIRSFQRLRGLDQGYRADRILSLCIDLTESKYPKPADQARYFETVVDRVAHISGVASVGVSAAPPLVGWAFRAELRLQDLPGDPVDSNVNFVSAGYFRTMHIPLLRGREFGNWDRIGAPLVAVVNAEFARRYCSAAGCLGRSVRTYNDDGWASIVGITGDVRPYPEDAATPEIYYPYLQSGMPHMVVLVRAFDDPAQLAGAVRTVAASVDPEQPPYHFMTYDALRDWRLQTRRVNMLLMGSFAALALALGGIGVYGVMAFAVAQRRHEIGVRLALGAPRREIVGLILRRGLLLIGAGAIAGAAAGAALSRWISSLLWGVTAKDPQTWMAVAVVLAASGLAACWVPARRASRLDPMAALRHE